MNHTWQSLPAFGGHVFLDFINTIDDETKMRVQNGIPDWQLLLKWFLANNLLDSKTYSRLSLLDSKDVDEEYSRLIEFREDAYSTLSQIALSKTKLSPNLSHFKNFVGNALQHAHIIQLEDRFDWVLDGKQDPICLPGLSLGLQLLDFLKVTDLKRLKECGRCTGLFLNSGRGLGRRWCRMETCGNREKTIRFRKK